MQQVNLIKSISKKSSRISALLIVLMVLSTVVIIFLISLSVGLYEYHVSHVLRGSQKDLIAVQKDYNKILQAYPLLTTDTPLVDQVKKLERVYKKKKDEVDSLKYLIVRRGFSEYLLGLAETTPDTLWLNEIHIDHNSENIILGGYSINPDAVSTLMNRLLSIPAYNKTVFTLFVVKSIKNHSYVKFAIATKELGTEEEKVDEITNPTSQKPKE